MALATLVFGIWTELNPNTTPVTVRVHVSIPRLASPAEASQSGGAGSGHLPSTPSSPSSHSGIPRSAPAGSTQLVSGIYLRIDGITPCCTSGFTIQIGAWNTRINDYVFSYTSEDVQVSDDTGQAYTPAAQGVSQVQLRAQAVDANVMNIFVSPALSPGATTLSVTFPVIAGKSDFELADSLR